MKPKPVIFVLCFNCLFYVSCDVNPACECVVYQSGGGSQGTFTSPNFPQIYPPNIKCILYTFIGALDEIVELNFIDFDLQVPDKRCDDYIRFFLDLDRPEINEKDVSNYEICGNINMIQRKHYSSKRALIFEFHTDSILGNHTGFSGRFQFLNATSFKTVGCKDRWGVPCTFDCVRSTGEDINTFRKGIFFSPKFPQNYPPNMMCQYHFRGDEDERIRIVFTQMQLETSQRSCTRSMGSDSVTIRDGVDANRSKVLARYCGTFNNTRQVISSGRYLLVEFRSDDSKQSQGFSATFEFIRDASIPSSPIKPTITTTIPVAPTPDQKDDPKEKQPADDKCNDVISSGRSHSKSGYITSPQYPKPYKANTKCHYRFKGTGNERVQLEFVDLDLVYDEGDPDYPRDCDSSDMVEIQLPGDPAMDNTIGVYCGRRIPPLLMSSGTDMEVIFIAESAKKHNHKGFNFTYKFVTNFGINVGEQILNRPEITCGFKFNSSISPNGTFPSPNFPGLYPRNTECHYLFYGQTAEKVYVTFPYFHVDGIYPPCLEDETKSDYIAFSNFDYPLDDRKMPRLCGPEEQLMTKSVESDRNFFRVTFKSNYVYDDAGFEAFYQFRKYTGPLNGHAPTAGSQASSQDVLKFSTSSICFLLALHLLY